jgi:hypothetical protein
MLSLIGHDGGYKEATELALAPWVWGEPMDMDKILLVVTLRKAPRGKAAVAGNVNFCNNASPSKIRLSFLPRLFPIIPF